MTKQELELIKTRNIILKTGEESEELVLVDEKEGDMYFSFLLEYVSEGMPTKTRMHVTDKFHAKFTIETIPSAIMGFEPHKIGTYGNDRGLYIAIRCEPCNALGEHGLLISFYTEKH